MPELDVAKLFEQAVINGLRAADPIIRQRNALRVPMDAHTGAAVRAELARLAAEDPSEPVRAACADALAFLEADTAAITARLAATPETRRSERLRRWIRSQFTVLVPAPAMGPGPWPYFGPPPESSGPADVPPTAALEHDRISFGRLPAGFEGLTLRVLLLSEAQAGWQESKAPVAKGSATVQLRQTAADAREIGDIWVTVRPAEPR